MFTTTSYLQHKTVAVLIHFFPTLIPSPSGGGSKLSPPISKAKMSKMSSPSLARLGYPKSITLWIIFALGAVLFLKVGDRFSSMGDRTRRLEEGFWVDAGLSAPCNSICVYHIELTKRTEEEKKTVPPAS